MAQKRLIRSFIVVFTISVVFSVVLYGMDHLNWVPNLNPKKEAVSVTGNADLATQFARAGADGLTWETAYVIENYAIEIKYSDNFHAIYLNGVTLKVIIKNSNLRMYYNVNKYYGVYLKQCANIRIINVAGTGFTSGIMVEDCEGISISNCNFDDNEENGICVKTTTNLNITNTHLVKNFNGLKLYGTVNCNFDGNVIQDNYRYDVLIQQSSSNKFSNNIMGPNGMKIYKMEPTDSITQDIDLSIDSTNTVNGKQVYLYQNHNELSLEFNQRIGQLILVNCENGFIKNAQISKGGAAVQIYLSKNITCDRFNISESKWTGIHMIDSSNTTIQNSTLSKQDQKGIYIGNSDNSTIRNTTIVSTQEDGVLLYNSANCTIFNNTIDSSYGVYMDYGKNNIIESNYIHFLGDLGLYFEDSQNNTITSNIVKGTGTALSFVNSIYNNLTNNKFYDAKIDASISENELDTSNTLNDKKIYYYRNINNFEFNGITDISTLLLNNCQNASIGSMSFDNTSCITMDLKNCRNITLTDLIIKHGNTAIRLMSCNNITVNNSVISLVSRAIYSASSNNVSITNNRIHHGVQEGIGVYLYYTDYCDISNNSIFSVTTAIKGYDMDNSVIKNNTIQEISSYAAIMDFGSLNNLTNNSISDAFIGFYLRYCDYCLIKNNTMIDVTTCIFLDVSQTTTQEDNTCVYSQSEVPVWGITEIILFLALSSSTIILAIFAVLWFLRKKEMKYLTNLKREEAKNLQ